MTRPGFLGRHRDRSGSPASFVCAGQWIANPTRRSVLLAICT